MKRYAKPDSYHPVASADNPVILYMPDTLQSQRIDHRHEDAQRFALMSNAQRNHALKHDYAFRDQDTLRLVDYLLTDPEKRPAAFPDIAGAFAIRTDPTMAEWVETVAIARAIDPHPDLNGLLQLNPHTAACYRSFFFDIGHLDTRRGVMAQLLGVDLMDLATPSPQTKRGHLIALHLGHLGVRAWLGGGLNTDEQTQLHLRIVAILKQRTLTGQLLQAAAANSSSSPSIPA